MVEPITAEEFRSGEGVEAWQAHGAEATATFDTKSFMTGVALVNRIADLAEEANHHPDIELSYPSVTVRMSTHEVGALTERDVELARRISRAADDLGVDAQSD